MVDLLNYGSNLDMLWIIKVHQYWAIRRREAPSPSPSSSQLCSLLSIEWLKEFEYIVQSLQTHAFLVSTLMYTKLPPLKYKCPVKISNLKQALLTLSVDKWENDDLLLYIEMPWNTRMPNVSLILSCLHLVCSLCRVVWYPLVHLKEFPSSLLLLRSPLTSYVFSQWNKFLFHSEREMIVRI